MDLNQFLPDLERLEADGAIVLLKWDGKRKKLKKTVMISKPAMEYLFRRDTDDLENTILEAIADYDEHCNTDLT